MKKGLPLQPTLVTVVVALIVLGAGGVGALAYTRSRSVVEDLWGRLSDQIATSTTQRTLRYFDGAVPYVDTTERLATIGRVDPSDHYGTLDYFRAGIEANPHFTWLSHGALNGTYVAVQRRPDGSIRGAIRTQLPGEGEGTDGPVTRMRVLVPDGSGWRVLSDEHGSYDPRLRPWFRSAMARDEGAWVEPFLFATARQPGFMYVRQDRRDGRPRGVWAVEYEVSYLSEFLSTLEVGETGRVYVVTQDGTVVGHPEGDVTAEVDGEPVIARAEDHQDEMLRGAWAEATRLGPGSHSFAFDRYLAMVEPFPEPSGIQWLVLLVVPEADFFGSVRQQARNAVLIAVGAALLAVLLGVYFSSRVSGALQALAEEMGKVGRFELTDTRFGDDPFFVTEVNVMREATDAMKRSLRSFGKYVPRELVRELITSGEEAVLGGRKAELTTLFADVAGFTSTAEKMDPAELVPVLGDCLESVSEAVRQHGGTVDKYIGDAIMAFWGAPRPVDNHALAACRAALAIQRRLLVLQERWEAEGKPVFSMRVGLNTGDTVVGNIGAPERMNYTVIGDAVNLASRLEGLNKTYGTLILMGEETARQVDRIMVLRPLDYVAVAGKSKGVLIHELLGSKVDVAEPTLEAIALYREALDAYRDRQFAEAAEGFDAAREAFGGQDQPSDVMAARSRAYAESPPADDWDGAFVASK